MNEDKISGVIDINGDRLGQSEMNMLVNDLRGRGLYCLCPNISINSCGFTIEVRESRKRIEEIIGVIEEISSYNDYEVDASKILAKIITVPEEKEGEAHQSPDGLKDPRKIVDGRKGWKVFK